MTLSSLSFSNTHTHTYTLSLTHIPQTHTNIVYLHTNTHAHILFLIHRQCLACLLYKENNRKSEGVNSLLLLLLLLLLLWWLFFTPPFLKRYESYEQKNRALDNISFFILWKCFSTGASRNLNFSERKTIHFNIQETISSMIPSVPSIVTFDEFCFVCLAFTFYRYSLIFFTTNLSALLRKYARAFIHQGHNLWQTRYEFNINEALFKTTFVKWYDTLKFNRILKFICLLWVFISIQINWLFN